MEPSVLLIGTVTEAIRVRRLLNAARIGVRLTKRTGGARGCVYGITLHPADFSHAVRILNENHISYEWMN